MNTFDWFKQHPSQVLNAHTQLIALRKTVIVQYSGALLLPVGPTYYSLVPKS